MSSPALETMRPRLDSLLPRRPRRKKDAPPVQLEEKGLSRPARLAALGTSRRGLFASLTGSAGSKGAVRRDPVLALVDRITPGFDLAEYERAKALGYDAYLEEQLAPETIDDSALDARLAGYTTLGMSPKQLYDTYAADFTVPYYQFKGAALLRSAYSRRALFERMVEFWNDHFSIDHNKADTEWLFMADNDRLKIRPNVLGSFPALLSAVAHGDAMLFYLDNWLNVAGAPQENYARELLELHSLGVQGGYTEVDVKEVAKCFTGWTLNPDPSSPNWLRGYFDPNLHTNGQKFVLGNVIPSLPPRENAQRVIDIVAAHPSTAGFLGRKLIRWFLTPTPSQALVDRVTSTYLATNGDIKAVLRVILAQENVASLPDFAPKFRRPFHLMVTLLRTLEAEISDPIVLIYFLSTLGHVPFDHVQPNGYPDTVAAWGSSLLPRWTFASELLSAAAVFGQPFYGVTLSLANLRTKVGFQGASDVPGLAQRINERLLGRSLAPLEVQDLQAFADTYPGSFGAVAFYETIALGASLPGFQWY